MGKSVSRVGGQAQLPAYRTTTGNLKLAYAQFEELENYARFGTRLDEHTRAVIDHGQRIRGWLKQPNRHPMPVAEQLLVLLALTSGLLDAVPVAQLSATEDALAQRYHDLPADLLQRLVGPDPLNPVDEKTLLALAKTVVADFQAPPKADETPTSNG